jgi:copper(I)-binding protein
MHKILAAALLTAGFAMPAQAQTAPVVVSDAWSRATAASARAGGVFLSLHANGTADRVTGASTPVSETAELHQTVDDKGVMKMLPVAGLAVEPGHDVALKPGSYHIMLMGLKRPLKRGESFPITLTFEKSPPITVNVDVQGPGASGPTAQDAMSHGTMHPDMPKPK